MNCTMARNVKIALPVAPQQLARRAKKAPSLTLMCTDNGVNSIVVTAACPLQRHDASAAVVRLITLSRTATIVHGHHMYRKRTHVRRCAGPDWAAGAAKVQRTRKREQVVVVVAVVPMRLLRSLSAV